MNHRILFYTETASYGGAERALETVIAALASREIRIAALIPNDARRICDALLEREVLVKSSILHKKSQYRLPFVLPWLDGHNGRILGEFVNEFRPTAIVVNQPDPEEGISAIRHLRNVNVPVISWLHCPQRLEDRGVKLGRVRTKLCSWGLRTFHGFIVPSQGLVSELHDAYGVSTSRIAVAENGVDPFVRRTEKERLDGRLQLAIEQNRIVLAFVGRIHFASKGLDRLAKALIALGDLGARFVVCVTGEGPDERALRVLAGKTKARWIFRPWTHDVRAAMLPADAFVLPSRYEGLPLSALEAASLGLPLYISDFAGAAKVFPAEALVPSTVNGWETSLRTMLSAGIPSQQWWERQNGKYDQRTAGARFIAAVNDLLSSHNADL